MNNVFRVILNEFVVVFIENILIYPRTRSSV